MLLGKNCFSLLALVVPATNTSVSLKNKRKEGAVAYDYLRKDSVARSFAILGMGNY